MPVISAIDLMNNYHPEVVVEELPGDKNVIGVDIFRRGKTVVGVQDVTVARRGPQYCVTPKPSSIPNED